MFNTPSRKVHLPLAVAFSFYRKNAPRQREQWIGVWSMEQDFPGASGELILNLKDGDRATIDILWSAVPSEPR